MGRMVRRKETVSALILWITGNSLVCRKGSHSDAEVYARYQHLHFYDKEQTRQCQGTFYLNQGRMCISFGHSDGADIWVQKKRPDALNVISL